jgi:hypothetical protein
MDEGAWMKKIKWMKNLDEKIDQGKRDRSHQRYQ